MRFVDIPPTARWAACVFVAASLTGCASMTDSLKSVQQAMTPASKPDAAKATASVVDATRPEAPVPAAAQRAFDDATRAQRAGRSEDAERGFRALSLSNPDLAGPHANLGVILRQAGKLPESVAELEAAVKLSPKQPVYQNQLGVSYRQAGQFDKAREAYERAIALDADYAAPYLNLGILNDLYLGDGPRALELYRHYLALSPSGDAAVTKWVAELKTRKPAPITVSVKEKS